MIFRFCRINLSDHVYLFLVVLLIFKVICNDLSDHVYIFHVVLLIFKVGRNNLSDHVPDSMITLGQRSILVGHSVGPTLTNYVGPT